MHIVFLTSEYPLNKKSHGGIGTFVKFLAENLIKHGINVSVIGIYNNNETVCLNNVTIYKLKKSQWKLAKFYDHNIKIQKKIKEIQKKSRIDIIEGSELNFAFFQKKTTYKKVIRLHGGHHFFALEENKKRNIWKSYQEKTSFKKADFYVSVSKYVSIKTKKILKFNFKDTLIYNSINLKPFYKSSLNNEIPFKLLFVGTVCHKKGIDTLIEAMPLIKKIHPNVNLEIIGRDWFTKEGDSYIKYLRTRISKGLEESITFTGNLPYDDLPAKIESAQVCVYPSLSESFGLTLIEGMAMGKCIVASNIKSFSEIVGDSKSVTLFEPNSKIDLSKKIIDLLNNEDKRHLFINKSRNYILENFKTEQTIEKNITFYKSII